MDQRSLDLSKAKFSTDDSLLDADLSGPNGARTLGDGVTVSYDSGGDFIVRNEAGEELPKHIVTVAADMARSKPAMVWLCYDLPDGGQNCVRVRAGGIHTHTAY